MPDYLISPKAPLIFRNGKPFGTEDNFADTLAFPLPSTIAGAMRTAWAESQPNGFDYANDAKKLLKKTVLGPLLARFNDAENKPEIFFPAPADSLCLNDNKGQRKIHRLYPDAINTGDEGTDLPSDLLPVFLDSDDQSKPAKNAPKFWSMDCTTQWLIDETTTIDADKQLENLPREVRTHVSIDPQTQTAVDGHLFHTEGLDFSDEFGLLSWFQDEIPDTYRTIGGESRLGHIQQQSLWPDCPLDLSKALSSCTAFRLVLATPAIFSKGFLPGWLNENYEGQFGNLTVKLRAASLPRWQAGTSWNMADSKSKQGKGMRTADRLVPAGAVYWFDLISGHPSELSDRWLTSLSDERDQDGYGLVLPGVWTKSTNIKD